jgi:dTDP-4-amino-4,6-dideoxygalactose transaminase
MSDVLAAFLYAQLEVWQTIQSKRQRIWEYYDCHLRNWAHDRCIRCPTIPAHCQQSYHMYYLVLPSLQQRQSLISFLKSRSILSVFHYLPLNTSPMGQTFGGKPGDCPVTEDLSDRLVRLPFYNSLTQPDQDRVIKAILESIP